MVKRYRNKLSDMVITEGKVVEHIIPEYKLISILRDVKSNTIMTVDSSTVKEATYKTIYLGRKIKVILEDNKGRKFVGQAECKPNDLFIPQVGHDIAYKRALIKKLEAQIEDLCM